MELVWKELNATRLICSVNKELPITGVLPASEGRAAREVLDCRAKVSIESAAAAKDSVEIAGSVTMEVIALDEDGAAFAFESRAGFTHTAEAEGAVSGMDAEATAAIDSVGCRLTDEGVEFEAHVGISLIVSARDPLRVIGGVNGVRDMELKTISRTNTVCNELFRSSVRMREELAEAGIAAVLSCSGMAFVREAVAERDGVSVSGVLTVSAVTQNADGRLGSFVRQVPFREKLNAAVSIKDIKCRAHLDSLSLYALGEEFSLLALDAEISFALYGTDALTLELPADAFSPTLGFDCLNDEVMMLNAYGTESMQTQLRDTAELPIGYSEIAQPLFASVCPAITSCEYEADSLNVSGVLTSAIVYESQGGTITRYGEDIPFSICMPCEHRLFSPIPCAKCECAVQILGFSERAVQLAFTLQLDIGIYDVDTFSTVAGLAEKEPPKRFDGLIIAFASEGDGYYEIAKRYSVPRDAVCRLNPDLKEPFGDGEKLLLMT